MQAVKHCWKTENLLVEKQQDTLSSKPKEKKSYLQQLIDKILLFGKKCQEDRVETTAARARSHPLIKREGTRFTTEENIDQIRGSPNSDLHIGSMRKYSANYKITPSESDMLLICYGTSIIRVVFSGYKYHPHNSGYGTEGTKRQFDNYT